MGIQRYFDTSIWDQSWFQSIQPDTRYLFLYLSLNPLTNVSGIYQITDRRISFDTGIEVLLLPELFARLALPPAPHVARRGEFVIIPGFPSTQKWEKCPNIQKGIEAILKKLPRELIEELFELQYQFPLEPFRRVLNTSRYSDSDSDSDLEKDTDSDSDLDQFGAKAALGRAFAGLFKAAAEEAK